MSTSTQVERTLSVTSSLGPDALLLQGFSGTESIGWLFNHQLELASENDECRGVRVMAPNLSLLDERHRETSVTPFSGCRDHFRSRGVSLAILVVGAILVCQTTLPGRLGADEPAR